MSAKKNNHLFSNLNSDFPASIVVFLVALPLCLGIALASGAPLFSGIIAGIVGGTVVALLSGSPLGVSGPAAGLAVIVLTAIDELDGAFEVFLVAVVIAGVIQLILGFLKAGVIGYYFPSSVIKGMLAGIGVIIILKQIPHVFGYDKDPEGDLAFQQVDGHNTFSEFFYMFQEYTPSALIIALISIGILILWEQSFMKRQQWAKLIQGPLVVVVLGIVLNQLFQGTNNELGLEHLVSIPVADDLNGFIAQFTLPDFSQIGNQQIWIIGATIAVVASLETLLCVEATDKLDPMKRVTPTNRELKAQGVGNIISGMIGGLPITQVIVRSSANIQSGGKSKASAFIHGIMLLVCAFSIPKLLNQIPLASLAAILLLVGYKLAKPALFKSMYQQGSSQFIPFIVTIVGIVVTDLLIGIALGMAVAIVHLLWNNYRTPYHFDPTKHVPGQPIHIELSEDVSFLNKASIQRTLDEMPENTHVVIDAHKARTVHADILEIFDNFRTNAKTKNIQFEVIGLDGTPRTARTDPFKIVQETTLGIMNKPS
ncbi:MAG: SulP family inorganic anion transporter [Bacteroidota bacterium]